MGNCYLNWNLEIKHLSLSVALLIAFMQLAHGIQTNGTPPKSGLSLAEQSPLPSPPLCRQLSDTRLIGGQLTQLEASPWTALIEYENSNGSVGFHCGGTLIDQQHILTAAHCVRSLPGGWKVHAVRLGEWDLSAVLDCQYEYCNDPPIDINVAKIIVHEDFDERNGNYNHNIALIRLEQQINYSETIHPICLPQAEWIQRENLSKTFSTIDGWGKSQTSAGLAKKYRVNLRITDPEECSSLLQQARTARLCAFGERGVRNLICSADSGGGLQHFFKGFQYLIGVAGSEESKCGTDGTPVSFMNVANYIEWIRDNVKL